MPSASQLPTTTFAPINDLPFQRPLSLPPYTKTPYEGNTFPGALQVSSRELKTVEDVVVAIEGLAEKGEVDALLKQHGGALLIRGTHASTPEEFSRLVQALKLGKPHAELGNPVIRNQLAPFVATANEGPSHAPVFPHSEFGWSSNYPSTIVFFCRVAAEEGGETPINTTTESFARLQAEVPEFIEELAAKGITYTYRYQKEVNPGSNLGNNISRAYDRAGVVEGDDEATIRSKVESQIKLHSDEWTWNDDGSLEVVHKLSVIRRDPLTQLPIFFGNLCSFALLARKWEALEPPHLGTDGAYHHIPTYNDADRTPIPTRYLEKLIEVIYDARVLVKWQVGDLLVLDNHLVQHGREPWEGERKVLASLWDGPQALPYK